MDQKIKLERLLSSLPIWWAILTVFYFFSSNFFVGLFVPMGLGGFIVVLQTGLGFVVFPLIIFVFFGG